MEEGIYMLNKVRQTVLLGLCVSLLGISAIAQANPGETKVAAAIANIQRDAIIVRIATGQAQKKSPGGEWLPLAIGADLANDDLVKTGKNSTVLLELPENVGFIRLLPETEIKVNQIKVDRGFEGGQIAELSVS